VVLKATILALENLLFKIILVVKMLAHPKPPMLANFSTLLYVNYSAYEQICFIFGKIRLLAIE
jgi:hypothetical protein